MASDEQGCSVCLKSDSSPFTLPCGHRFCSDCADHPMGLQGGLEIQGCPKCQEQKDQSGHEQTGVFCDYCTHSPVAAVQCCLLCETSVCVDHLKVHSTSEEHVLVEVDFLCTVHKKLLISYCCNDATFLCEACSLSEEHREHHMKPLEEALEEKKAFGRKLLSQLTLKMEENEEKVHSLEERKRTMQEKIASVKEKVSALFLDIKRDLEELEKRLMVELFHQEEIIFVSVSEMLQQLERQKEKLSEKMRPIEELCNMTDPLSIIEGWKSIREDFGKAENRSQVNSQQKSIGDLDQGLISATLHTSLSQIVTDVKKDFYVRQSPDIALNENTASNDIWVSGDSKTASASETCQNRPKMLERFQHNQVLSRRSFQSGQHYWEVETGETGNWRIGMAYPSITRKGYHSLIGHSCKSWGLCRYFNQYFVIHDRKVTPVPHKPACQQLGVYLDYEAGELTFYELGDPIRQLYTFSVTFSEPLYVVLGVYTGWVRIRN
ncbi:E3 ubiquitin-protein ligase TRIM11-like [Hyperolius riggenbachi]|uniref:E3 ubiquitin-protein ligase TRIM11-like n=1 Tax=Hyperolius riggenbachi TaxID=752182 RepID=UPI0035A2FFF3